MASQNTDAARARASSHTERRSPNHSAAVRGCGGSRNSYCLKNSILDAADPAVETEQQEHTLASTVVCRFYVTFGGKPNGGACARIQAARDYEDRSLPQLTWLILRDGTSYLARDYWLEASKLVCVTLDWDRRLLPLARLDLDETVRLNRERHVEFVILLRDR